MLVFYFSIVVVIFIIFYLLVTTIYESEREFYSNLNKPVNKVQTDSYKLSYTKIDSYGISNEILQKLNRFKEINNG